MTLNKVEKAGNLVVCPSCGNMKKFAFWTMGISKYIVEDLGNIDFSSELEGDYGGVQSLLLFGCSVCGYTDAPDAFGFDSSTLRCRKTSPALESLYRNLRIGGASCRFEINAVPIDPMTGENKEVANAIEQNCDKW